MVVARVVDEEVHARSVPASVAGGGEAQALNPLPLADVESELAVPGAPGSGAGAR